MNRTAFILLLTLPAGVFGQDKSEMSHTEIRAMRDGLLNAIKAKDADAILAHLHPDVVLTTQDGKNLAMIRKHAGVREYLERMLTGPKANIKSLQPTVTVDENTMLLGDETGIAFGHSADRYVLTDGNEFELPTRWSATLVKHEGRWKIVNLQTSTNLFDNPVLRTVARQTYWAGGVALIVGFLAGIAVMRARRK